jgi:hypothetical protein
VVERNGLTWLGATQDLVIGTVEAPSGDPEGAERRLRDAREVLTALGDVWWVASLDSSLCLAVGAQDRPREFLRLADALAGATPVADPQFVIRRQLLMARALLLRGNPADAEVSARRGVEIAGGTDLLLDHATAWLVLAEILDARDLGVDARSAREEARALLEAKAHASALTGLVIEP